ncbi:MAG: DNA replication complex subunit Gins51 [Promethearchaeota archaeon]|jgi:DNA replication initiation complex subunit (GINS family)
MIDLKKDYEKLYQHWLKEFQETGLTSLDQDLFKEYNRILNFINNHQEDKLNNLKIKIFEAYKNNINFLFEDLFNIRKVKILNSAIFLKDIDLDNVIEAEKLLYQNLVSSIKGYDKVKAILIFEEQDRMISEEIEANSSSMVPTKEPEIIIEDNEAFLPERTGYQEEEVVDYTLLRFKENTPPLVGIDLLNYGPFEKEDIAFIPSENAKILILEKIADEIDIT